MTRDAAEHLLSEDVTMIAACHRLLDDAWAFRLWKGEGRCVLGDAADRGCSAEEPTFRQCGASNGASNGRRACLERLRVAALAETTQFLNDALCRK